MANVSVFNLEGNEKPVPKFPAVVRNRGDRKVPDMQDRVQQELRSGRAAA